MKKTKKILTSVLALCMVFALAVPAFADNIETAGGSSSVPVTLTVQAARFSATVPTTLPVSVSADGEVTVATNLKIVNNSNGQIKVASVEVSGENGWGLVAFDTDYASMKTDSDKFGLKLQSANVPASGSADVSVFAPINGNGELALSYDASVCPCSAAMNSQQIASAVFTLTWNT